MCTQRLVAFVKHDAGLGVDNPLVITIVVAVLDLLALVPLPRLAEDVGTRFQLDEWSGLASLAVSALPCHRSVYTDSVSELNRDSSIARATLRARSPLLEPQAARFAQDRSAAGASDCLGASAESRGHVSIVMHPDHSVKSRLVSAAWSRALTAAPPQSYGSDSPKRK